MKRIRAILISINILLVAYLCGYYMMLDSYTKKRDRNIRVDLKESISQEEEILKKENYYALKDSESLTLLEELPSYLRKTFPSDDYDSEPPDRYSGLFDSLDIPRYQQRYDYRNTDGEIYYSQSSRSFEKLKAHLDEKASEIIQLSNYLESFSLQSKMQTFKFITYSSEFQKNESKSYHEYAEYDTAILKRLLWVSYVGNNGLSNNHNEAWKYLKLYVMLDNLVPNYAHNAEIFPFESMDYSSMNSYLLRNIRVPPKDWENYFPRDDDYEKYYRAFLRLNAFKYFDRVRFPGYSSLRHYYFSSDESLLYNLPGYSQFQSHYSSGASLLDDIFNGIFFQKYLNFMYVNTFFVKKSAHEKISDRDLCSLSKTDLENAFSSDIHFVKTFSLSPSKATQDIQELYKNLIHIELTKKVFYLKRLIHEIGHIPEVTTAMETSEICPEITWKYDISNNRYIGIELSEKPLWLTKLEDEDVSYTVDMLWVLSAKNN